MLPIAPEDLRYILDSTPTDLWEELRDRRIFLTGGTGFFGCWLLESLLAANDRYHLGASATVLTRDPARFSAKAPHLAARPALQFVASDVRTFAFPDGRFDYIVHAATEASASLAADAPLEMFSTITEGTARVLAFAQQRGVRRLLFTSSGAVYGRQPSDLTHVPEDYTGSPDSTDPRSAYGVGKRAAEQLCAIYTARHGVDCTIARCFAFAGPHLPLHMHFAIGNFIRDALNGGPVRVAGDGTARRSYLYAADLAIWLWTILLRGTPGRAYNVGSEQEVSIGELAGIVARELALGAGVEIARAADTAHAPERYVPSTLRARSELGLAERVSLVEVIRRTAAWHRAGQPS